MKKYSFLKVVWFTLGFMLCVSIVLCPVVVAGKVIAMASVATSCR